jgi:hypothetical protein
VSRFESKLIFCIVILPQQGYKEFTEGDPALKGSGVWTISNLYFPGATNVSSTAIATARKYLGYTGTDSGFDCGKVYGDLRADPSRQIRSSTLLRDLASDHKLTKVDVHPCSCLARVCYQSRAFDFEQRSSHTSSLDRCEFFEFQTDSVRQGACVVCSD